MVTPVVAAVTPLVTTVPVPIPADNVSVGPAPLASPAAPAGAPPDPRIATLNAELERYRARDQEYGAAQRAQQYAAQLEAQGWLPDHASAYAALWAHDQQVVAQSNAAAKVTVANLIAQRSGVPAESLAAYATPAEMENAARSYQSTNQRISALEAELAKFRGAATPAQPFDSGSGGTASSDSAFLQAYGEGRVTDHARAMKIIAGLTG